MLDQETIELLEYLAERVATKTVEKLEAKKNEPEKFIDTLALQRLKHVSACTISRWINQGCPVEKGRPNRFKLSKVEKWLESKKR